MRRVAMVLAGLAMAQAAQAQRPLGQTQFCADLERVLEDANGDQPFYLLENGRAAPPGLGFVHGCRRSGDARQYFWLCTQNLAPPELSVRSLMERVQACLPNAPRPTFNRRSARFELPDAVIRINEHGTDRAHVGRSVTLVVEAPAAARAASGK